MKTLRKVQNVFFFNEWKPSSREAALVSYVQVTTHRDTEVFGNTY